MPRLILLIGALVLVVVGAVVAAVVWSGSDSDASGGRLGDALAVLPADAASVTFTDAAASRERVGFGDLTSDSPESEIDHFVAESTDAPWAATSLGSYYLPMDEWGWTFLDVEWEATYQTEEAYASAFKLRDDIDMDAVLDSFTERGYEESEVDGYPAYSVDIADLPDGENAVPALLNVVAVPDDRLLLAGPDAAELVDAATGDGETLADSEVAGDLASAMGETEYLYLSLDEPACLDPIRMLGETATPEALEAYEASLDEAPGYSDLQEITGHAAGVATADGDVVARAVAGYADDDTAAADVEPRSEFVDGATSPISGQPYSEIVSLDASSDGSVVTYDLGGDDVALRIPQMIQSLDLPWASCPPAG